MASQLLKLRMASQLLKLRMASHPTLKFRGASQLPNRKFMKPLIELLDEKSLMNLATPSDLRLGKKIFGQGGVEIIETGPFKIVAKSQPRGGHKRTVTLISTEDGVSCKCT
jgi:hypothetical protein